MKPPTPKQLFHFAEPQVSTPFDEDEAPFLCRERMYYHLTEKTGGVLILIQSQQRRVPPATPVAAGHPRLTVISTMFTRPKNPPLSSCELWFYPCPWTTWKEDRVICWLYFVSSMDAPLELVLPSSSSEYSWRSRRRRHSLKNVPDNLFKVSVSSASSSCIGVCCCSFPWRSLLSEHLVDRKNIINDWSEWKVELLSCCSKIGVLVELRVGSKRRHGCYVFLARGGWNQGKNSYPAILTLG